ncbi:NAD(P)H-dependent oxidoreductase [Yoonia sp.]|uniref:NAD(P)H-dependent oxidoreductase n=1 Tax=Yoonia sp. TaxID=2212373 RepID=UPI0019D923F7|nr:NAD(P)H-dependent oxidoreductase [Yoonia sp.]MBE0412398.1 NAD(P)H-dependent oxidoreductase [Yoonia sp.]
MATTLIVLAHPDKRSFNGAWAEATAAACAAAGDQVLWSDLYAQGFDPAERSTHYDWPSDLPFDPLKAQERAAADAALPDDVQAEIAKIRQADRVIFHFPLWWFAPPAMLKGWCERALAHGALHSVDQRFDKGQMRGKKVLFCVTTGSKASESAHNGKESDVTMLLWPLAYTLRYLGFDVVQPRCAHGVHGYHRGDRETALRNRLTGVLAAQHDVIARFDTLPLIPFNADDDFVEEGRLRSDRPSHSAFIRHNR